MDLDLQKLVRRSMSELHQSADGGNFPNASARSTVTGTLSSKAPGGFQVLAVKLWGAVKLNSGATMGLPLIMSLNLAMAFLARPYTAIGYDHGDWPPDDVML